MLCRISLLLIVADSNIRSHEALDSQTLMTICLQLADLCRHTASEEDSKAGTSDQQQPAPPETSKRLFPDGTGAADLNKPSKIQRHDSLRLDSRPDGKRNEVKPHSTERVSEATAERQHDGFGNGAADSSNDVEPAADTDVRQSTGNGVQEGKGPAFEALSNQAIEERGGMAPSAQQNEHRLEDSQPAVDPEVLASLPPDIQRELKLASMMKMGNDRTKQKQSAVRQPVANAKQKRPSITNFFSSKP